MLIKNLNTAKVYQTLHNEVELNNLPVVGNIPSWLSGSFVSNGPAQFEIGKTQFNHWFDGFAMLKKFEFQSQKVSFKNKFLNSQEYSISDRLGCLYRNGFSTYAKDTVWGKIRLSITSLIEGVFDDNCNVNIACIAERFIAMTESSQLVEFDFNNLNTLGAFYFNDNIKNQMSTAHPHRDPDTNEIINIALEIGRVHKYHIYSIKPHSYGRNIIATYVSDQLFYMHSFSITPDYVILFKSPLRINALKLLFNVPFNNTLFWKKNKTAFFVVIDRRNGKIFEIETDPFICLHSVNGYQKGNELILDLICHNEGNPYNNLYLSALRSESPNFPTGILRRYILDLHLKKSRYTSLFSKNYEFPRLNYRSNNGKDYRFFYANFIQEQSALPCAVEKIDLYSGGIRRWEQENYYPAEPVFVSKPNSKQEDEGILIFIAFNSAIQYSSLIILDAQNMQQLAEISLPFHLPFGLHGNFYQYEA